MDRGSRIHWEHKYNNTNLTLPFFLTFSWWRKVKWHRKIMLKFRNYVEVMSSWIEEGRTVDSKLPQCLKFFINNLSLVSPTLDGVACWICMLWNVILTVVLYLYDYGLFHTFCKHSSCISTSIFKTFLKTLELETSF